MCFNRRKEKERKDKRKRQREDVEKKMAIASSELMIIGDNFLSLEQQEKNAMMRMMVIVE